MEVDAGSVLQIVGEVVGQMHDHVVTPVCLNRWAGQGAVDCQGGSRAPVGSYCGLLEAEPVLARHICLGDSGGIVGVDVIVAPLIARGGGVARASTCRGTAGG